MDSITSGKRVSGKYVSLNILGYEGAEWLRLCKVVSSGSEWHPKCGTLNLNKRLGSIHIAAQQA